MVGLSFLSCLFVSAALWTSLSSCAEPSWTILLAGVQAEVALSQVSFDVIFVPLFLPSLAIQQLLQEAGDGQCG